MTNKKVFSQKQYADLTQNLRAMQEKHESFEPVPFSQEEMLQLFIKRDEHQTVIDAARLFGVHNLPYYVTPKHLSIHTASSVIFQVSMLGVRKFGFPTYAGQFVDDAPDHLIKAFQDYCDVRVAIAKEWGLVNQTLAVLNDICATPSQVAFLWPSIHTLNTDAQLKELLNKKPKTLPAVPPPLREACAMSAATITMSTMLGTAPPPNRSLHIHVVGSFKAVGPMGEYVTRQ